MDLSYIKNKSLDETLSLNNIEKFQDFDTELFLKDKILAIEKVIVDTHIKILVRIIEDNTIYEYNPKNLNNTDKIITLIIDENIAEYINIVNVIGKKVEVKEISNNSSNITDINSLSVKVNDIDIKDESIENFRQKNKINKNDYKLVKTTQFKKFNYNNFLNHYKMNILTIYPQSPKVARIIILITDSHYQESESESNIGKTFSIKIEMDKKRNIPLHLLIGNKEFKKENLIGKVSGTIVKNNQVLLFAETLKINHDNNTYIINNNKVDINKDINDVNFREKKMSYYE